MKVWLFNPYGPIPGEGWRDYRFTLVARALASRGHEVVWWTACFAHQTKRFRCRDWSTRVEGDRFAIELVPTRPYSRNVSLARLWFEFDYARRLMARARSCNPPDLIIAADPPQAVGRAGRLLAGHFEIPLILDCLDLWPELFVRLSPPVLRPVVWSAVQPLRAMRRANIQAAELVVCAAESYRRVLEAILPECRFATIPIGVDLSSFEGRRSPPDRTRIRVVYAGSLGEAYDLEALIRAAAVLDEEDFPVEFVVAGRGAAEESIRRSAAGLRTLTFLGSPDTEHLAQIYAESDVAIASYAKHSTVALPLKLFDYLAAGLPVVTSLEGEARDLLRNGGAGVFYRAGDAASLVDAIRSIASSDEQRRTMSEAARTLAVMFDSESLYGCYVSAVEQVCNES